MWSFQLALIVTVAMLPPFGVIVGGVCVGRSCSVDRKAETLDKLLTEKELDPFFLLISFWIFYCCNVWFCGTVEEGGSQHCC